jgi:sortase (surface protein transpeptidase)
MAVGLFSFGIYTNLHSLAVTKAIQAQAAVETANQNANPSSSTPSSSATTPVNAANVNEAKPTSNSMAAYSVAPDKPKYITIPSLGVYARVIEVGITKDGAVGTPSNTYDTAWFNQSAKPGQSGATFIDGHVLGPIHGGVFAGLKNIQAGAQIIITMGDNSTYSYTVHSTSIQNKDTIIMNSLLKSIDPNKSGLNLMTCTGTYIQSQKTYNNRFIVYAVKN